MKKVLHIGIGEYFGGIEQLDLEYAKHINRNKNFQIDVLMPNKRNFKYFESELNRYGSNLYDLNILKMTRLNELIYDCRLFKFLRKNKYDVVHINSEIFFYSFRVALISKLCKVKTVISHSHSALELHGIKRWLRNVLNPIYRSMIDEYLSCSREAQKSLYTDKFISQNKILVLKNGIEVEDYKFNNELRKEYRNSFNLNGKTVYGHVGRFRKPKNHNMLIDIFYNIQKQHEDSVLLLMGDGDLREQIENKVNDLHIQNKVIFLGFREDVSKILNAVDFFIFPSLYEGLGIALVEAQANGMPVFCTDTVPIEAKISEQFCYFRLEDDCKDIAKKICSCAPVSAECRAKAYKNAIANGYDTEDVCKQLENIYFKCTKG